MQASQVVAGQQTESNFIIIHGETGYSRFVMGTYGTSLAELLRLFSFPCEILGRIAEVPGIIRETRLSIRYQ